MPEDPFSVVFRDAPKMYLHCKLIADTSRMEFPQFSFRLIRRSGWLLAMNLILAGSPGAAADEGAPREVILLAEGETMQYSTYAGEPADWYSAMENLA